MNHPLSSCKCWDTTQVTLFIQHCPSLNESVRKEIDKVTRFINEHTSLHLYGKVKFSEVHEAKRSPHDVPSMPPEADA